MSKSLISQTNDVAHAMFKVFGYMVPEQLKMWRSRNPTALLCWKLACGVQKSLRGADVPAILAQEDLGVPLEETSTIRYKHGWVLGVDRGARQSRIDRCPCGTELTAWRTRPLATTARASGSRLAAARWEGQSRAGSR